MEFEFKAGEPISEEKALAKVAAMGFHALAFDAELDQDESLHWHEFDSVTWVIEGTGSFLDGDGNITEVGPGCHVTAPAGWLHANLAGPPVRVVLGTSTPSEQWTAPINKDPADRPASLAR